jgi:hypothetical protein
LKGGIAPPPTSTWCATTGSGGFSASRSGPTFPVAPAFFSVWHDAQFAPKIAFPFGAAALVVVVPPPEAAGGAAVAAWMPQLGFAEHFAT